MWIRIVWYILGVIWKKKAYMGLNWQVVTCRSPGKQLRLFDIREKPEEFHVCGWDQGKSEPQSALINAAWSPDGWYISSGSNDPLIHIFDIRYHLFFVWHYICNLY